MATWIKEGGGERGMDRWIDGWREGLGCGVIEVESPPPPLLFLVNEEEGIRVV